MTVETVKRLKEHFTRLAEGQFSERDFDDTIRANRPGEEEGRMSLGKMPEKRRSLIMSDAKRHLKSMEDKSKLLDKFGKPRSDFSSVFSKAPEPVKEEKPKTVSKKKE